MEKLHRTAPRLLAALILVTVTASRLPAATATVDPGRTHQTLEGFGASLHYYSNWLTAHPNREDIYHCVFDELGLDILRIGNIYGYSTPFRPDAGIFVAKAGERLGRPVKVLMSSWSPPAHLKSNGRTQNGGTLVRKNGAFDYEGLADYWAESLDAYETAGIVPEYVSIQNEPGFAASWETCELLETEKNGKAGYDKALNAVARKLADRGGAPKLLASEVLGIGYGLFQNYARYFDHDLVYGYAHHLYHGGDPGRPDQFIGAMRTLAADFGDKPRFQTEYSSGDADWLNTAWIMHNALVHEQVSAYLHWGLIWGGLDNAELVQVEFPWDRSRWTTAGGYVLSPRYYAFRQFSRFTDPGWKRIDASVDSDALRVSAFLSADGDSMTVVALNVSQSPQALAFDPGAYRISCGRLVRTSETEHGEDLGPFDPSSPAVLPARSITTFALQGYSASVEDRAAPAAGFSLEPAFPNPFNPLTTLRFNLPCRSPAVLRVTDLKGVTVRLLRLGLLDPGTHAVRFDGAGLASGLYLYRLETDAGRTAARTMILSK